MNVCPFAVPQCILALPVPHCFFDRCAPRAHAERVNKSYTVSARASVHVDTNDAGTVTTSNSKQVEFRVEYQGYELNKDLLVDSRQDC